MYPNCSTPPPDPREQAVMSRDEIPLPHFDSYRYRPTPESIAHAKQSAARERAEIEAAQDRINARRIEAKQQLIVMVDEFGLFTVRRWLHNMEAMGGTR